MREYFLIILIFIMCILSALAHENDIYQSCIDRGNSGKAMWMNTIMCSNNNLKEKN